MKYKKTPCPSRHGVFLCTNCGIEPQVPGFKQHFYYLQIILENFQYCFMVGVFQLVEAL